MTVAALKHGIAFPRLPLPTNTTHRILAIGTLSGLLLSAGLLALPYYACGAFCLGDAIVTTAMSILAGIATVSPVTALTARD